MRLVIKCYFKYTCLLLLTWKSNLGLKICLLWKPLIKIFKLINHKPAIFALRYRKIIQYLYEKNRIKFDTRVEKREGCLSQVFIKKCDGDFELKLSFNAGWVVIVRKLRFILFELFWGYLPSFYLKTDYSTIIALYSKPQC